MLHCRLLYGCSSSRQCNIFIGCKLHGRIPHTVRKPTTLIHVSSATVAQSVQHRPQNPVVLGWIPSCDNVFHMFVLTSAHVVGTVLSSLGLGERQLQCRTALSIVNHLYPCSATCTWDLCMMFNQLIYRGLLFQGAADLF